MIDLPLQQMFPGVNVKKGSAKVPDLNIIKVDPFFGIGIIKILVFERQVIEAYFVQFKGKRLFLLGAFTSCFEVIDQKR